MKTQEIESPSVFKWTTAIGTNQHIVALSIAGGHVLAPEGYVLTILRKDGGWVVETAPLEV